MTVNPTVASGTLIRLTEVPEDSDLRVGDVVQVVQPLQEGRAVMPVITRSGEGEWTNIDPTEYAWVVVVRHFNSKWGYK